jgi:hypothetical protein
MSGPAMKYRVRLAFDGFQVGHEFISPPMSRAYAQVLQQKGLLEIAPEVLSRPSAAAMRKAEEELAALEPKRKKRK